MDLSKKKKKVNGEQNDRPWHGAGGYVGHNKALMEIMMTWSRGPRGLLFGVMILLWLSLSFAIN